MWLTVITLKEDGIQKGWNKAYAVLLDNMIGVFSTEDDTHLKDYEASKVKEILMKWVEQPNENRN